MELPLLCPARLQLCCINKKQFAPYCLYFVFILSGLTACMGGSHMGSSPACPREINKPLISALGKSSPLDCFGQCVREGYDGALIPIPDLPGCFKKQGGKSISSFANCSLMHRGFRAQSNLNWLSAAPDKTGRLSNT